MVWALAVAAVLLLSPAMAYADPIEAEPDDSQNVVVDSSSLEEKLDRINDTSIAQNSTIQEKLDGISVSLVNIERYLQPEPVQTKDADEKDTEDYLIGIQETLTDIGSKLEVPEEQEQKSVTRAQNFNFVCYANAPSTGTYATYAAGLVPRLKWSEHYVFLQDTSSSYTIVYGDDLAYNGDNTFTGTNCRYVRWYYANQQYGYQTETGTGDVSVSTAGHVVLSDLSVYPTLQGTEEHALRLEVAFYACVAIVIRTLHHVWRFTLRNGNGTMAD